jgi:hypothetical protein
MRIIIALLWISGTQDPFLAMRLEFKFENSPQKSYKIAVRDMSREQAESSFPTPLRFVRGVVVNSPPTGACVVGCGTALGKSFLSSRSGVGEWASRYWS